MFQFFTLGGKQFWEDVFYYQKWRIQRHYRTHKYRLLDNWDICRAKGSFEECRQAFVKFIEIYEIPRQSGKMIILLHGLARSKNIFKPLIKPLEKLGYNVAAINYPSTRKNLKAHTDQLNFFLKHTEDVSEVSFITQGMGCLLLRDLIETNIDWNNKFQIGKIINVNPINTGSSLFASLTRWKIFNMIFGKCLAECTPENAQNIPHLPKNFPLALIFCQTYFDKLSTPLAKKFKGIDIPGELKEKDFSPVRIYIKNSDLNIFDNKHLIDACVHFIKEGKL
ncbi:MAG: hypothetical protein J5896_04140 [Alphaproteobacteria bacterium]|nr:hypothetical protein [Alphaproteobacteria bacterium]